MSTQNDQFLIYESSKSGITSVLTVYGNRREATRCRYPSWFPPLHAGLPRETGKPPPWPPRTVLHPWHAPMPELGLHALLTKGVGSRSGRQRVKQWLAYPQREGLGHRRGLMRAFAQHPDWAPYCGRLVHVVDGRTALGTWQTLSIWLKLCDSIKEHVLLFPHVTPAITVSLASLRGWLGRRIRPDGSLDRMAWPEYHAAHARMDALLACARRLCEEEGGTLSRQKQGWLLSIVHAKLRLHHEVVRSSKARLLVRVAGLDVLSEEAVQLHLEELEAQGRLAMMARIHEAEGPFTVLCTDLIHVDICAAWSRTLARSPLPWSLASVSSNEVRLLGLHHPLLASPKSTDVTFQLGDTVVITGAHAAGKSTLMRAVAWCLYLHHVGCMVPCEAAALPWVQGVTLCAEHTDAEGASTWQHHLGDIRRGWERGGVCLVDECCRGTNTKEGEETLRQLLPLFQDRTLVLTTHFRGIGSHRYHMTNYQWCEGEDNTSNVLRVLDDLGYPADFCAQVKGYVSK